MMPRIASPPFTAEQLIEALDKTRGFVLSAQKYLLKTYGIKTGYKTIKAYIHEWGMQEWLDEVRKSLVEDCLSKAFYKGISEGDNVCLGWVLERYLHHIDFLDGKDTDQRSKKGWEELLTHAKGTIEPNTEEKSNREHCEN